MTLDRDEVLRIARLARLELDTDEAERMVRDLGSILGYVAVLDGLEPEADDAPASGTDAVLRDDLPGPPLGADRATRHAPGSAAGLFRVPRVLDE